MMMSDDGWDGPGNSQEEQRRVAIMTGKWQISYYCKATTDGKVVADYQEV